MCLRYTKCILLDVTIDEGWFLRVDSIELMKILLSTGLYRI